MRFVRDHGIFRDDDDAVADKERLALMVKILDAVAVEQLDVLTDADILIDDGTPDLRVFTDSDMRSPGGDVVINIVDRLKKVRTHNDRISDIDTVIDTASEADDRIARPDAV